MIAGDPSGFAVAASSSSPLTYQWRFNGGPIGGATNSSLVLPETQPAQAGSYSVIVSNTAGAVTSSNATLAVVIPTCTPAPAGLVGWWPGEGGGEDSVAGHNGVMKGGVGFGPGKVGQAFTFNGTNGVLVYSDLVVNYQRAPDRYAIGLQPFGADGRPTGDRHVADSIYSYSDGAPRLAMNSAGSFAIAFRQNGDSNGGIPEAFGRLFWTTGRSSRVLARRRPCMISSSSP